MAPAAGLRAQAEQRPLLGLKRTTLVSKMKRLRIYRPRHQRSMGEFNEGSSARQNILLCFR